VDEHFFAPVSMWGWHILVRQVASSIPSEQFDVLLSRIPLPEQRRKWATVAADSFSQEELDAGRDKVARALHKLETLLADGPWIIGDQYCLADINTYSLVAACTRLFPDLANPQATPNILAWFERMNARDAVQAARAMPNHTEETLRRYRDGEISFA
jgi:glutathione S-transferase